MNSSYQIIVTSTQKKIHPIIQHLKQINTVKANMTWPVKLLVSAIEPVHAHTEGPHDCTVLERLHIFV